MDLTDAQWERVAPLIPNPPRRKDGRGRPRRERREVLAGVLWILRTGAQWAELPGRYPHTRRVTATSSSGAGTAR